MNFIFFGRLTKEKGFDLLVQSLSSFLQKTGMLPGDIFIFGEGGLGRLLFESNELKGVSEDCSHRSEKELAELIEMINSSAVDNEPKIRFFGWQTQSVIRDFLGISHFSLMPSRFLETFGLSALESLAHGVPVIGFQKGGLVPFIQPGLSLLFSENDTENIEAMVKKFEEVIHTYELDDSLHCNEFVWNVLSHESRRIADLYTEGRWIGQLQDILPKNTRRILIASDYVTLLGGIEIHVQTIARVLRAQGYQVEIFGWNIGKTRWTKGLRLVGLMYSFCNISSLFGIRNRIRTFMPDVIWLHSVSRFLGPLVVREVTNSGVFSLVTYHDLGIFSPFPSQIESEDIIPRHPGLISFVSVLNSINPLVYVAAYCKYFQVALLRRLLMKIHMHLVPSVFLVRHVQNIVKIPDERIVVLEHFL